MLLICKHTSRYTTQATGSTLLVPGGGGQPQALTSVIPRRNLRKWFAFQSVTKRVNDIISRLSLQTHVCHKSATRAVFFLWFVD